MGCVATVRGALEPIPGIANIAIEANKKPFKVEIEKGKVDAAKILAALEKAGEPAKQVN